MKKTSKKILFFGNEKLATGVKSDFKVFRWLVEDSGHDAVGLILSQKKPEKENLLPEIAGYAKYKDIEIYFPSTPVDIEAIIDQTNADGAILAAYGKIVPEHIINKLPLGIINIHPSLLPLHRGSTPIESAIINGDTRTGVSIMKLALKMDAGPVYAVKEVLLTGQENKQELADLLDNIGKEVISGCFDQIIDGGLLPNNQDESQATYDKQLTRSDGLVEWSETAAGIYKKVRAFNPWPGVHVKLGGLDLKLIEVRPSDKQGPVGMVYRDNSSLGVYTKAGSILIDKLQPAGRNQMTAASFIAGYGQRIDLS